MGNFVPSCRRNSCVRYHWLRFLETLAFWWQKADEGQTGKNIVVFWASLHTCIYLNYKETNSVVSLHRSSPYWQTSCLQVYRNLESVTEEALDQVKRNFQWVADKLDAFIPKPKGLVNNLNLSFFMSYSYYFCLLNYQNVAIFVQLIFNFMTSILILGCRVDGIQIWYATLWKDSRPLQETGCPLPAPCNLCSQGHRGKPCHYCTGKWNTNVKK